MTPVASYAELERLLADDLPYGDLTTEALGIGAARGVMRFVARDPMVLALAEDAAAIVELAGCRVELLARTGDRLVPGSPILTAHGEAAALLKSWKVAQTLIEIWSGVASSARAIVDAARAVSPDIAVACTRKNIPGTKPFAVAAVKAGGAVMHRLGLSETVLVFPEHRVFLEKIPLTDIVERLRRSAPEKRIVAEVTSFEAAIELAVAPQASFIGDRGDLTELLGNLLDNACKWCRSHVRLSAAIEPVSEGRARLRLSVEDDGPGVSQADRERILERGVRTDETVPGHGIGLAMVLDTVELYGGTLTIEGSPLGGACFLLRLPGRLAPGSAS